MMLKDNYLLSKSLFYILLFNQGHHSCYGTINQRISISIDWHQFYLGAAL